MSSGLNVVALISGGKDSFFSLLHCRAQGHRVVALANLHPPSPARASRDDDVMSAENEAEETEDEKDLNSFMYQTVGHEVIPLYGRATGLPLYRHEISGGAGRSGKDYYSTPCSDGGAGEGAAGEDADETESMVPLLRVVMRAHPEVDAVCAGAILSTYQRTRVESVAVRLGLTPLAYLWKYPALPVPVSAAGGRDDGRLLEDMRDVGLEARMVKVASGGLDEDFLWEDVASTRGVERLRRAMRRFGAALPGLGAVIGEGGEFETLVVDGPDTLFRQKIVVEDADRSVVREGGGTAWLKVRRARVEEKEKRQEHRTPRVPDLLDERFEGVLRSLDAEEAQDATENRIPQPEEALLRAYTAAGRSKLRTWCIVGDVQHPSSIEAETTSLVKKVTDHLHEASLPTTSIISTVIALRNMTDFPTINKIYGSLFTLPNPPSRVTISCGSLIPADHNIAVYLSVVPDLAPSAREGLHVQSRSYWAPANIGPYSQAISIPVFDTGDSSARAQLVHSAGQIPLIPATMALPPPSKPLAFSAVLALQHLWRIGTEMGVQRWSSAVAYLPRTGNSTEAREKALLASRVWRAAHAWSAAGGEEDDDNFEAGGPDLWDRRHNHAYLSFAAEGADATSARALPDLSVLRDVDAPTALPAFFAAEVDTLPREAGIEWHAHLGFAKLDEGGARVVALESAQMRVQHTLVSASGDDGSTGRLFVLTVLAVKVQQQDLPSDKKISLGVVLGEMRTLYLARMAALAGVETVAAELSEGTTTPAHLYVHSGYTTVEGEDLEKGGCPVIPCYSLWDARGEEVAAVAVYQEWLEQRDMQG